MRRGRWRTKRDYSLRCGPCTAEACTSGATRIGNPREGSTRSGEGRKPLPETPGSSSGRHYRGRPCDELIGKNVEALIPADRHGDHEGHRANYWANPVTRPMGQGLTLLGRRKDGSQFPVKISLSPVESEVGLRVTAVIRDVSERQRAQEQIRHHQPSQKAQFIVDWRLDRRWLKFSHIQTATRPGYQVATKRRVPPQYPAPICRASGLNVFRSYAWTWRIHAASQS